MSGKKQAFKDILRNCFPVVLDDLLDQPNQEKTDIDSIETKTGKKGEDYHTESPIDNDTVPLDATVSRGDTVSLYDTVSFQDTVSPDDPVFSPDTQLSSVKTNFYHSTDITNFFKMEVYFYSFLSFI